MERRVERERAAPAARAGSDGESGAREGGAVRGEALRLLVEGGPPSDAAAVGLHRELVAPELVQRVLAAARAGARLGAAVPWRGRTLRQIVDSPQFDWGAK